MQIVLIVISYVFHSKVNVFENESGIIKEGFLLKGPEAGTDSFISLATKVILCTSIIYWLNCKYTSIYFIYIFENYLVLNC